MPIAATLNDAALLRPTALPVANPTVYTLTDRGRQALREWARTPVRKGAIGGVVRNPYAGRHVEDIAPMIVFLASSQASWITGQAISVNGGFGRS